MKQISSPYDSPRTLWLIVIGFLLVWFYMLGARTLVPTDEGRYAEMAREMLVTGDWITPRLNGIKYFEKPPLQAWMNVITFEMFGLGDWQARLWTGLCGLLSIALVAHTGRKVFNARIGINAALVLGSSLLWAASSHYNSLDMAVAAMMSISLCGLLLSQRQQATAAEQRNGMVLCWVGMALAVLSKGLIGVVLPGAVLIIYTFVARDWSIWKRLHMGKGLLIFFAIVSPWFILVALKNPEHPHFFFIHEHLQRFTSNVHKRYQPAYFFIAILALGIFPWLGLLLQGMWSALKKEPAGFQPKKMLLVWSAFIFVFFSISNSKLTGYILPIFPSLALLIALQLESASSKSLRFAAGLLTVTGLGGLAFVLMAPAKLAAMAMPPIELALNQAFLPWLMAACLITIVGGLLAIVMLNRQKDWAIISMALAGFIAGQTLMLGYEPWGYYRAGLLHLKAIQAELKPDTPIYSVGMYEQCLPFYLGRTLILVEHADELEFGLEQQPELWIPKRSDFIQKWRADNANHKPAIAILRPQVYEDMLQQQVPMRIIAQDPKRMIVSNQIDTIKK
ncbi:MAG: glycosyltransferase family 39 protein [Undibacterium sp.]|uniref:glycosyltransferase family 39 protein n=1 Tax=Undibacterium sp. TaxID=1914977 RepID=UPI002727E27B|nr:glycosyltransferase family 39 protein [Undibacterium sp.]MDO8650868.1 glycosyltransferase family 39 protein [Undibacterium sp.]